MLHNSTQLMNMFNYFITTHFILSKKITNIVVILIQSIKRAFIKL